MDQRKADRWRPTGPHMVLVRATKEGFDGQGIRMPGDTFLFDEAKLDRCSWVEPVGKSPERSVSVGALGRVTLDDAPPRAATEDEWADLGRPE